MTPEHIHAIAHLRRVGRWDPPMVTAVLGHLNGADYYGPLLSMKELRWTPWERSALEEMAAVPPAQRAIAWEGGDLNQAVRTTLGQLPDVAEAIWQGLDAEGRRDVANAVLLAGPRKIGNKCSPARDLDGVIWALSRGGDPNAADERTVRPLYPAVELGDRPLHVAARLGLFHRIEPLLAQGADPTLVNRDGDTARDLLVSSRDVVDRSGWNEERFKQIIIEVINGDESLIAPKRYETSTVVAALDHAILYRAAALTERPSARRRM